MLKRLIILVLALLLVSVAFIPVVNAQVGTSTIKQRLVDEREDFFNALIKNDLRDIIDIIILAILLICLGVVEGYVSTIMYNEDNDLYPILTQLFKMIFMIPALLLTCLIVLIIIIFDPLPYPELSSLLSPKM